MHDDREAEVARQSRLDRRPGVAAVVAAVHAEVVLGEEAIRPARMHRHLVHALAVLGKPLVLGQVRRLDPPVRRLPGHPAVGRAVHARGRHRHHQPVRVRRMGEHGVQARPAAAREPLAPVRMVPEPLDEREAQPAVLGAEERVRLDPRVDHAGLAGGGGLHLPDARQRGAGSLGEGDRGELGLVPRRPEVVGVGEEGTPVARPHPGEEAGRVAPGVECDRVHVLVGELQRLDGPGAPVGAAGGDQPLAGPDEDDRLAHLRMIAHRVPLGAGGARWRSVRARGAVFLSTTVVSISAH